MSKLKRLVELAERNGWAVTEHTDGSFEFERENRGDGFPFRIVGRVSGDTLNDGELFNDYGDGPKSFPVKTRYIQNVLKNVGHPFLYKTFLAVLQTMNPNISRSEKEIGRMIGVSERQIRRARICGFIDDEYMVDALCLKVLKLHPSNVYGFDNWVNTANLEEV